MKIPSPLFFAIRRLAVFVMLSVPALTPLASAAELPEALAAEDPGFQPVAESRTEGIIRQLDIDEADRLEQIRRHVHNFIVRTKNINEGSRTPEDRKRPELEAARARLYAAFDNLRLNDEQRLIILNALSANHYRINYDAFINLVPDLTAEEKSYIHSQLKDVTHEAILLNSGSEKGELFVRRRGRINNYLSDRGYDLRALSEVRNQRIRAGRQ